MYDLSEHKCISFEVTDDCNMKNVHHKCPIHHQQYDTSYGKLNEEKICLSIEEANRLNFKGYIEFHHYNEPLLNKEMILNIMQRNKKNRFILITNGLLLSRNISENEFLKQFSLVTISCYYPNLHPFFEQLKKTYGNIIISTSPLDDRLAFYDYPERTDIAICPRVFFELPIDHYGNVRLCCFDWQNKYKIGNINKSSLREVVESDLYQNILHESKNKMISDKWIPCRHCEYGISVGNQ